MSEFLDSKLVYDLREVINKTNIFVNDSLEKEKFDLICAVMDQFDNSILYLNTHQILPSSENEIILFFHHCCIIRDGINVVSKMLNISIPNTLIFEDYCYKNPINLPKGNYKGDDKFFEYIRSLLFAHPFVTSRSIPNPKDGETQYCPYILDNTRSLYPEQEASIGVMVYSNKQDMFHLCIKFEDVKKYITQKYLLIRDIILAFRKIIDNKEIEWRKRKVNRELHNEDVLLDIIDILKERYIEYSDITELYKYLTCDISNKNNIDIINKYREIINNSIPSICDCIDNMDYDSLYEIINPILMPKIKEKYPMMHYQLEKIYCYLSDDDYGDIYWGLIQADEFSKHFAKNWVEINAQKMDFVEIRLLTTIACYYESRKEMN